MNFKSQHLEAIFWPNVRALDCRQRGGGGGGRGEETKMRDGVKISMSDIRYHQKFQSDIRIPDKFSGR
jgi:hypothetical protein